MRFERSKVFGKIDVFIQETDDCIECGNKTKCALINAIQEGIVSPNNEFDFWIEKCPQFNYSVIRRIK